MFPGSKAVKSTAKAMLKNNWIVAITTAIIPVFLFVGLDCIIGSLKYLLNDTIVTVYLLVIYYILLFMVMLPICLGVLKVFVNISDGKKFDFYEIFYYFSSAKQYHRAVLLIGCFVLKVFSAAIALILFSYAVGGAAKYILSLASGTQPVVWLDNLWVFSTLIKCIAAVSIVLRIIKFYGTPYIFVNNDYISPVDAMNLSNTVSAKSSVDFIFLLFSMIHIIVLTVFVVPAPFTLPYLIMAYVVHSKYAVNYYNQDAAKNQNTISSNYGYGYKR